MALNRSWICIECFCHFAWLSFICSFINYTRDWSPVFLLRRNFINSFPKYFVSLDSPIRCWLYNFLVCVIEVINLYLYCLFSSLILVLSRFFQVSWYISLRVLINFSISFVIHVFLPLPFFFLLHMVKHLLTLFSIFGQNFL